MTKEQMTKLIMDKVEAAVAGTPKTAAMDPAADWASTKSSVMKIIIDGIVAGISEVMAQTEKEIRADIPTKEKLNEIISHINMLQRYASTTNPLITIPSENDKLGNLPYAIKPLT